MALKTILFAVLFAAACGGAVFEPIWGVLGYVGHYCVGPDRQWWNAPLRPLGIRYSFTLAVITAAGIAINWGKLRFGRSVLCRHEKLMLLFLGIVWLSVIIGPETVGRYTRPGIDHPSVKLTKIIIFAMMLTHVVTDPKNLNRLLWVLVVGALILGLQAYSTPYWAFDQGRLERVGGPDFHDANALGAYLVWMLPIIGVQFLRTRGFGRLLCLVAGVFATNAIILTRSRGAFLGLLIGGLVVGFLAPRKHRVKILAALLVAALGGLYLSDSQFLARMSTIMRPAEERDTAAQSRILLTRAGLQMVADHPLGVGTGNFYQTIGKYLPEKAGRDAHNTYICCLTELGLQGFGVLTLLILNGWFLLRHVMRQAANLPPPDGHQLQLLAFGMTVSLAAVLGCSLTGTYVYMEGWWWVLMLPVCVSRATENVEVRVPIRDPHRIPEAVTASSLVPG